MNTAATQTTTSRINALSPGEIISLPMTASSGARIRRDAMIISTNADGSARKIQFADNPRAQWIGIDALIAYIADRTA